jgi:hypothetical protein
MQNQNFDSRRESRLSGEQCHIGRSLVVNTSRAVALGFIAVAASFFLSVSVTIYGGFPLWFL